MAVVESATQEKFLPVTNESEFFPVVKEELRKRNGIYGDQETSIKKIAEGSDRSCELLLKETKPVTLLIYKTEPVTKSEHVEVSNSLEIKTFLPIDKSPENLRRMLDRALALAKEKETKFLHLTCSEREKTTFNFLVNNGFQVCETWDGKYVPGVKEYMMYKLADAIGEEDKAKEMRDDAKNENKCYENASVVKKDDIRDYFRKSDDATKNETKEKNKSDENGPSSSKRRHEDDRDDRKRRKHDGERSSHGDYKDFDNCTLMKKYIYYIKDGKKTVEARLNTFMFKKWREGTIVRFHCRGSVEVHVKITKIKQYKTFREMLEEEGYKNCVPDVRSVSEAVRAYLNIPNYKDREHLGVLAFRIQKVDPPRR